MLSNRVSAVGQSIQYSSVCSIIPFSKIVNNHTITLHFLAKKNYHRSPVVQRMPTHTLTINI